MWEESLGAGQLDVLLVQHFAAEFREKTGKDITAQPKAIAKLKRQVSRPFPPLTFSPPPFPPFAPNPLSLLQSLCARACLCARTCECVCVGGGG
jgi:Hsp70 protein